MPHDFFHVFQSYKSYFTTIQNDVKNEDLIWKSFEQTFSSVILEKFAQKIFSVGLSKDNDVTQLNIVRHPKKNRELNNSFWLDTFY